MKSALRRLLKGGVLLIAAALIVACQAGAPGKAGADGADGAPGEKGETGDRGPAGPEGTGALAANMSIDPITVNDDGTDVGTIDPIDAASMYFRGGYEPLTYALAATPAIASDSVFMVKVDPDTGMVTITARPTADAITLGTDAASIGAHYGRSPDDDPSPGGTLFAVTAVDDFGSVATTPTISVRRNRAPTTNADTPTLGGTENTLAVGTQDAFPLGATAEQKMNPCNMLNMVCAHVLAADDRTSTAVHFVDEDSANLMFSAISKKPEVADVEFLDKVTVANATPPENKGIVVTGISAGTAMVEVSAMDGGMLPASATRSATVTVNAAPTLDPDLTLPQSKTFSLGSIAALTARQTVVGAVTGFFKDDGTGLQIHVTVKSDPSNVISDAANGVEPVVGDLTVAPTTGTDDTDAVDVLLTGNVGSAVLEINAREAGSDETVLTSQFATATVTVNVVD